MKKISFVLLFAFLQTHSSQAAGDAEPCACEAEELGFSIDCADTTAMLASLGEIQTRGCAKDCTSSECVKHYYIVQSHHDYCPEADIPQEVEDGFHDYDETCAACKIKRLFTDDAPACPVPNCEDNSGNEAYVSLIDNGCLSDCSSDTCRDHFFMLRSVHDSCEHDVLSRASEEGLHDMEVPCVSQICNQAEGADNQLVCDDHSGHDHGDGAFEWAGVFKVNDSTHKWSMQKVDGAYADPTMRLVLFSTDSIIEETIHSLEGSAETFIEGGSCMIIEDKGSMSPVTAAGSCFELHVGSGDDSMFTIDTSGISGLVVYAQHVPIEFERDQHYFKDSSGTDIEPIAQEGGGGHGHGEHGEKDGSSGATAITATGTGVLLGSLMMVV
eukprot:CAMPEP_0194357130 /NCGR_PEP_ID=MMETSP0174-20130528/4658_1 /TAXON_ID=216777 /ORGANISM="Proboscia alata, Strain PI-D3" /LENGTH=383 /DNA_ID=CAMNT_0039127023 /DNA_START=407 /DNA_END=1558 /DNA_ORIENTATION=-